MGPGMHRVASIGDVSIRPKERLAEALNRFAWDPDVRRELSVHGERSSEAHGESNAST